jgi:type IX secretion system PorP/SprF family membrane protein
MKNLIATTAFLLISKLAVSQAYPSFSFYNYDPKLINAAYAGLLTSQDYQSQLLVKGIDPKSENYSLMTAASGKVKSANSGWGAILSTYRVYNYYKSNVNIQYNYQYSLSNTATLSIGTQWGFSSSHFDFSSLDLQDPSDPAKGLEEPNNKIIGDFGIALRIRKFNAGVASTNLIVTNKSSLSFDTPYRRYNLYTMHNFQIAPWLKFTPSFMLISTFKSSPYVELNGVLKLKDLILLGTSRELTEQYSYQKYIAGLDIKNRFQIVVTIYAGHNHLHLNYGNDDGLNLEGMLRWRMPLPN